jgi:hypothetical protein
MYGWMYVCMDGWKSKGPHLRSKSKGSHPHDSRANAGVGMHALFYVGNISIST